MTSKITRVIRDDERFLRHILQISGLGTYIMDVRGRRFETSVILDEILGLSADSPRTFEGWVALLHPDDREAMRAYFLNDVIRDHQKFDREYRIIRASDGAERWVHGYGELEFGPAGEPVVMTGAVQDITERKRAEKALQHSENRYRELVDLAADGILIGSHEGVIIDANRCFCEMAGMTRDQLVGRHIRDVLFTPDSIATEPFRFDLLQKGETVVRDRQILRADGSLAYIEMRTKMMPDGTYQSIYRDISERKMAETSLYNFAETLAGHVESRTHALKEANASLEQSVAQLRTNQTMLSEMGRMAEVGGWELDLRTGNQIWTEEVFRIHEVGYDFNPTKEKGIAFYAPAARPVIEKAVKRCVEYGEPYDLELEFITAKGNHRWVHAMGRADLEHGRIHGTFQDITRRRQADEAMREKNAALAHSVSQLRKLAMELTQAEERERKRLAAVLHDHVQQHIAAATMKVSLLESTMKQDERSLLVKETLVLLGEAIDTSRSLTVSLYPPVLLEAGLLPGLHWLAEWMASKHGLAVKVKGTAPAGLPGPLAILLFQAVRELLFNVVKHAGVTTASVALDQSEAGIFRVVVSDRGRGFPEKMQSAGVSSGGFGLFHLRERIHYIGGELEVRSKNLNTKVTIKVSL